MGSPIFGGNLEEYSVEKNNLLNSDHSAIKASFEFDKKIIKAHTNTKKRLNFNKTNWYGLFDELNDIDNNKYMNLKVNNFADSFTNDINIHHFHLLKSYKTISLCLNTLLI